MIFYLGIEEMFKIFVAFVLEKEKLYLTYFITATSLESLSNLLLQLGLYFEINIKKCLFGNINTKNDGFENLLLLYCKGYIWCCKYRNTLPTLAGFKLYVFQYLKTLQVIYTIQSRSDNFVLTWGILYGHLVAGAELPDTQTPPGPNLPVQDGVQD